MQLEQKKIYDPIQRMLHFSIAFLSLILILSAYSANFFYEEGLLRKSFWVVHIYSGFALMISLALRILWGIFGPQYARWSELWKWQEWRAAFKEKGIPFKWNWGHHPLASLAYLGFYLVLILLSASGVLLAAIEHNLGPFAANLYDQLLYRKDLLEIHETLSLLIILFILAHLMALYWHERKDGFPVVQSMFSGYQYRKKPEGKNEKDQN